MGSLPTFLYGRFVYRTGAAPLPSASPLQRGVAEGGRTHAYPPFGLTPGGLECPPGHSTRVLQGARLKKVGLILYT